MNKIYKVVWNTVRNCYVVGSELISSKSGRHSASNGKSSSLKVTLTVLALCGMTALGSGVVPAYAADGMGAVTAKNQYVALRFSSPDDGDSRAEYQNGQWHTTFNGKNYDTVDSGMKDKYNQPIIYWVRNGYSLTIVDGQPYTSLSDNGRRADVSWTDDANAKPSDILESVTSTHVQTNVTTNVGETLQQVNAGTYAGVSNSDGTEVNGKWNYIVKDSSWKGVVDASNYRNGYADLVSSGKPRGFVRTTDAGSKLAWNATLSAYTYNGKVVDYSNIYVIDGEIGVFTNASESEVYTGTVFGKNNEVLMTVKKSDGSYYSYWGAEVNDAGATMDTYRVAEYQKDLNVLRDNDFALYHNDIKSVDMSTNDSSATISLMRNGDGTSNPAVDGTLTITNGGGTGGKDTYVRISNTTNGQEVSKTFTTGSKVSAIGSTDATTGLTINGVDYTIKPDVSWTAQAGGKDVNAVNQKVNFVGSDHITVTGTDGQIKFEATGLADTDLTNITNTAVTKIQNIAKGEDVHIKADTYTVGNDGSVTMTYVDGNGNTIDGTAKITGIAKSDLSNITNKGNTVIKNIAKNAVKVIGGTNTAVETSTTDNGPVEYKVNLNKDVNLGDTIQLNGSDGSISAKSGGARLSFNNNGLTVSQAKNGVTNETRINGAEITVDGGIGNQTTIKGSMASIGSVLVNGGGGTATISGLTNKTTKYAGFATSGRAATEEQLKEVNSKATAAKTTVTNGKNITVNEAKADDGSSTYTVGLAKDVVLGDNAIKLNGSDGSISAKSGGARLSFNNNGLTVSQAKNGLTNETRINGAEITVDGGIGNQTTIKGSTARIGNVLVNGGSGTATITGLTNKTTDYTGFANGSGRAATEEQLKEVDSKAAAAKTTVTNGKNITVDEAKADDGSSTYTVGLATDVVLGDNAIKLNGSDGSISAKSGGAQLAFNNSGLTVSQAKNGLTNETRIDGATITVDGGTGNQTIINGSTARIGSVLVNGGSGTATITGLTNKTTDYTGFANGSGRAATEEQLKEVAGKAGEAIETAGKGWNLTTNGKEASKTNIAPDGTVDFSSSNDNLIISNAGANLSFSLSDNLDLTKNEANKGSVKVGKNTTLTDGLLQVGNLSLTANALTIDGSTYISASGINANKHKITNVLAGKDDMDAVNVGQLKSAIRDSQVSIKAGDGISVAKTGNQYTINVNIEGVTNNQGKVTVSTGDSTSTESGSESGSSGAKKFKVMDLMYRAESNEVAPETTTDTGKPMKIESIPEDIKLEADDNQAASVVNGETIKIAGDGTNISTKANVTGAGSMDTISVSLKPDIQVDSVTINNGGPTINNTGIDMNGKSITNVENITVNNGPTINSSGIDMNSQKIINLAEGDISETSTDAVNGGQLYNTNQAVIANAENINSLSHSLNKLDSRINRVGAGAAALAALHPLDFDPDNKWDFAAGYGNYAGANAVAIGTYYRPNENTMFSIGGSFGGGENMINAGVSFKLGSGGSGITTSKTVMAKKIKEQDELLKAQDAKMKEQDEKIAKLEALVAQQGEMIQQALGKK
ncbi:Extended Signal Peptide of Type V secretion system [Megasphaera elsdenii]|uniref:ESPR-type extended signal peptide-containing protein n=2 Tax=Megasphaera elsdenii TaxID=907 RepID=UPI0008EC4122|nr:YadA-like family protein [Megasphaera elsdenii]SFI34281.1 Extended Signal Peptide of Type V secretion system [Megasphaera elsdenii]